MSITSRRGPVAAPVTSRRRFLTTALQTTLVAGAGGAALTACADDGTTPSSVASSAGQTLAGTYPPSAPPVADGNQALQRLQEGNARFVADREENLDEGIARRVAVSKGQTPFATVLGCVDSRVAMLSDSRSSPRSRSNSSSTKGSATWSSYAVPAKHWTTR